MRCLQRIQDLFQANVCNIFNTGSGWPLYGVYCNVCLSILHVCVCSTFLCLCRFVLSGHLFHFRNELYCVGWGFKLYSLTHWSSVDTVFICLLISCLVIYELFVCFLKIVHSHCVVCCQIGVKITLSSNSLTKIVAFTPFFVLINDANASIHCFYSASVTYRCVLICTADSRLPVSDNKSKYKYGRSLQ